VYRIPDLNNFFSASCFLQHHKQIGQRAQIGQSGAAIYKFSGQFLLSSICEEMKNTGSHMSCVNDLVDDLFHHLILNVGV
jgi:hypothetical protein